MGISGTGRQLAPRLSELGPGLSAAFVREALHRAITGVGPLPAAAQTAEKHRRSHRGDVDRAIHDLIETHIRYAGGQGFLTNIGGLATLAFATPTNVTGLALVQ